MTLDVAALREAIHRVICDRPEGYSKHAAGNGSRCQLADPRMDGELAAEYDRSIEAPPPTSESVPVLSALRYQHANIAGTDLDGSEMRLCAMDRQTWPCQTVQAIDLATSVIDAEHSRRADLRARIEALEGRCEGSWKER